jgi:hypothetical protein
MNTTSATNERATSRVTLEQLARHDIKTLGKLYAQGTTPEVVDLEGTPRGRMLTWVGPLGRRRAAAVLRRFARGRLFPWAGKSFSSVGGVNRVRLLGDLFRFETRVDRSAVDGKPCLVLDYDLTSNPWPIRQIHDELRQVGPRLYLGPAMWKTKAAPKLILYFAIETA